MVNPGATTLAHLLALACRELVHRVECSCEIIRIAGCSDKPCLSWFYQFWNTPDIRSDHRATQGIGLQNTDRRIFIPFGGKNERLGTGHRFMERLAAEIAEELDIGIFYLRQRPKLCFFRSRARNTQTLPRPGSRPDQGIDAFFGRETPREQKVIALLNGKALFADRMVDEVWNIDQLVVRPSPFDQLLPVEPAWNHELVDMIAIEPERAMHGGSTMTRPLRAIDPFMQR